MYPAHTDQPTQRGIHMTTSTITELPATLAGLLAAVLAAGCAVSFSAEPEGVIAHVDVIESDDRVTTHTAIGDTATGALEAAAFAAGLAPDLAERLVFSDEVLAGRLGALEAKVDGCLMRLLGMLNDELKRGRGDERTGAAPAAPGEFPCCKHCEHYGDDSEWHGAPCGACADEDAGT
jgi:hypothetical protein